jgi:hypothetical protein
VAAETVVLSEGVAKRSISVAELATFAKTGIASRPLQVYFEDYLDAAAVEQLRKYLDRNVQLEFASFAQYLRSDGGSCLLERLASVVKPTPNQAADAQPLRAALVNAAALDGNLSLMEILQQYPTSQVHLDREQLSDKLPDWQTEWSTLLDEAGVPLENRTSAATSGKAEVTLQLTDIDYSALAAGSFRLCQPSHRS